MRAAARPGSRLDSTKRPRSSSGARMCAHPLQHLHLAQRGKAATDGGDRGEGGLGAVEREAAVPAEVAPASVSSPPRIGARR